jgi:hypothetical protein
MHAQKSKASKPFGGTSFRTKPAREISAGTTRIDVYLKKPVNEGGFDAARADSARVLAGISGIGAAALLHTPSLAAEGALETTSVRLPTDVGICVAPEYVVDDLLRAEGFTDIRHVPFAPGTYTPEGIAHGVVDFGLNFASLQVAGIDRGIAMKALAGVHVGCFELFVREGIRGVADLPGKNVGIQALGGPGAPVPVGDRRQCRRRPQGTNRMGRQRCGPPEGALH